MSDSGDALRDLYQDVLLEHSRNPRHHHGLDGATHEAAGDNPMCGDRVTVLLTVDDEIVTDCAFEGQGCAICTASASMMADAVIGQPTDRVLGWFDQFHEMLMSGDAREADGLPDDMRALAGVHRFPIRVKCATLPWHALRAALTGKAKQISTE